MAELLDSYRQQYPAYKDVDDTTLANGIYNKYYAGKIDRAAFDQKIGLSSTPKQDEPNIAQPQPTGPSRPTREDIMGPQTSGWGMAQDFTDAASLGVADEVGGAGGAVGTKIANALGYGPNMTWSQAYDDALSRTRADRDAYRSANPQDSLAAQLAGGFFTGGVGSKWASEAPGLMGKMMRGSGVGAGYGSAVGFNTGEGSFKDRVDNTMIPGGIGLVAGAGAPLATQAARSVYPFLDSAGVKVRDMLSGAPAPVRPAYVPEGAIVEGANVTARPGVTQSAQGAIARRLQRDGITGDDLAYNMKQMGENGVIADAGGTSTQRLLDSTAQSTGQTAQRLDDVLTPRQMGQGDRIKDAAAKALGVNKGFYQSLDDLNVQMRKTAEPLYRQAYAEFPIVDDSAVINLLERPATQNALTRASRMMKNEGIDPQAMGVVVGQDGAVTFTQSPSLQTLDYVKRGLDDVLDSYRDKTTGRLVLDTEGRGIENLRRQFVQAIDDATGGSNSPYAAARAAYAGPASQKSAMAEGRGIFKADEEITVAKMKRMSNDERAAFLDGVMRAVKDQVDRGADTRNAVRVLFGTPNKRAALRAAFDDEQAFGKFESALLKEDTFAETRAATAKGSQTAQRLADMAETGPQIMGSLAESMTTGTPTSLMASVGRRVFQAGTPESVRDEIGRILLSGDPKELEALRQFIKSAARKSTVQDLTTSTLGNTAIINQ